MFQLRNQIIEGQSSLGCGSIRALLMRDTLLWKCNCLLAFHEHHDVTEAKKFELTASFEGRIYGIVCELLSFAKLQFCFLQRALACRWNQDEEIVKFYREICSLVFLLLRTFWHVTARESLRGVEVKVAIAVYLPAVQLVTSLYSS